MSLNDQPKQSLIWTIHDYFFLTGRHFYIYSFLRWLRNCKYHNSFIKASLLLESRTWKLDKPSKPVDVDFGALINVDSLINCDQGHFY